MLHLCCIYTAQRRRRQYVLVETSTFALFWVKHELSSTDISKYVYKTNNNKKLIGRVWVGACSSVGYGRVGYGSLGNGC